jgi:uncharacterized protein YndB with AHSA1/START domain
MTTPATLTATEAQSLSFTHQIDAPVGQVYRAFTDHDWITYWFCDDAKLNAKVGGPFLLTWYTDYYAMGTFTARETNGTKDDKSDATIARIALNWRGAGDQHQTQIEITAKAHEGGTALLVVLDGVHPGALDAVQTEWAGRLQNLKSVLETGADQRITERVLIGIFPEPLDEKTAKRLGVPVSAGTRVEAVLAGLSAAQAGLQADDVIVEVAGLPMNAETQIGDATRGRKVGEVVQVKFYRGPDLHTIDLALRGYPILPLPADFGELAARVERDYTAFDAQIAALFAGQIDAVLSHPPEADEWSAKEVVGHLILNERWLQHWVGGYLQGPEIVGYTANHPARIAAVLSGYATAAGSLDGLRAAWAETVALLRAIPAQDMARKSFMWWASFEFEALNNHTRQHVAQIARAIEVAGAAA